MAKIEELTTQLHRAVHALTAEALALRELPRTEGELDGLLKELAEAERECRAHHKRFPPAEDGTSRYDTDPEHLDAWSKCWARREAAVRRVTELALRLHQEAPASEAVRPFWRRSEESSLTDKVTGMLRSGFTAERLRELVDLAAVREVLES